MRSCSAGTELQKRLTRIALALACVALPACPQVAPATPRIACIDCGRTDLLPGEPILASAEWSGTCRSVVDQLIDPKGDAHFATCGGDSVRFGVQCSAPCEVTAPSGGGLVVRPGQRADLRSEARFVVR